MTASVAKPHSRKFSPEFKQQLVDQCLAGMAVADLAIANDLHPKMLQRWIRERLNPVGAPAMTQPKPLTLIPLTTPSAASSLDTMIEIQIDRNGESVRLRWPVTAAPALSTWLTGWLK